MILFWEKVILFRQKMLFRGKVILTKPICSESTYILFISIIMYCIVSTLRRHLHQTIILRKYFRQYLLYIME